MGRKPKPRILEDLGKFAEIGGYLDLPKPLSISQIARKVGVSPSAVFDLLNRIKIHLGGVEIVRTSRGATSATSLTVEGRQYLEEILQLQQWKPNQPSEIRLGISHSLLTSHLLTQAFCEFQDTLKVRIRLQQSDVITDFEKMIRDLQTDQLDLAIVWSTEDRMRPKYPGIEKGEFEFLFDTIFISRKREYLPSDLSDLSQLAELRVVTMRPESLSPKTKNRIPPPNGAAGGERLVADTVDAVVAFILSGVCEIGLVPANYLELEPFFYQKKLFWTENVDSTKLLWAKRDSENRVVDRMNFFLAEHLSNTPSRKSYALMEESRVFPDDKSFYLNFRFGYYVDNLRKPSEYKNNPKPFWHWEEISMREDLTSGSTLSFYGYIRNSFKDMFLFRARLEGQLFYVDASSDNALSIENSVDNFVSVFNWYQETSDNTIMYGSWSGTDPEDKGPVIYGTFWSRNPLSFKQIRELAQTVRGRTALDSEFGYNFKPNLEYSLNVSDEMWTNCLPKLAKKPPKKLSKKKAIQQPKNTTDH